MQAKELKKFNIKLNENNELVDFNQLIVDPETGLLTSLPIFIILYNNEFVLNFTKEKLIELINNCSDEIKEYKNSNGTFLTNIIIKNNFKFNKLELFNLINQNEILLNILDNDNKNIIFLMLLYSKQNNFYFSGKEIVDLASKYNLDILNSESKSIHSPLSFIFSYNFTDMFNFSPNELSYIIRKSKPLFNKVDFYDENIFIQAISYNKFEKLNILFNDLLYIYNNTNFSDEQIKKLNKISEYHEFLKLKIINDKENLLKEINCKNIIKNTINKI